MSIESPPGLIDYWHDCYMQEMLTRQRIIEALTLPVTAEEKVAEITRITTWRLDGESA